MVGRIARQLVQQECQARNDGIQCRALRVVSAKNEGNIGIFWECVHSMSRNRRRRRDPTLVRWPKPLRFFEGGEHGDVPSQPGPAGFDRRQLGVFIFSRHPCSRTLMVRTRRRKMTHIILHYFTSHGTYLLFTRIYVLPLIRLHPGALESMYACNRVFSMLYL